MLFFADDFAWILFCRRSAAKCVLYASARWRLSCAVAGYEWCMGEHRAGSPGVVGHRRRARIRRLPHAVAVCPLARHRHPGGAPLWELGIAKRFSASGHALGTVVLGTLMCTTSSCAVRAPHSALLSLHRGIWYGYGGTTQENRPYRLPKADQTRPVQAITPQERAVQARLKRPKRERHIKSDRNGHR